MEKIFYVSKNTNDKSFASAPDMDRFQRVEKLNSLLEMGWAIKEFRNESEGSFFVLEKNG